MDKVIDYLIEEIKSYDNYKESENFSIDNYVDLNLDLIRYDLIKNLKLSWEIPWDFIEKQPLLQNHKYIISEYAKFLYFMLNYVLTNNLTSEIEIQNAHKQQYSLHKNVDIKNKKFHLL